MEKPSPKNYVGITLIGWLLIVMGIIALPTAFLSVPTGIGILRRKEWARISAVIFEIFQAIFALVATLTAAALMFSRQASFLGLFVAGIVGALLSIKIITYLRRPDIRDAFNKESRKDFIVSSAISIMVAIALFSTSVWLLRNNAASPSAKLPLPSLPPGWHYSYKNGQFEKVYDPDFEKQKADYAYKDGKLVKNE